MDGALGVAVNMLLSLQSRLGACEVGAAGRWPQLWGRCPACVPRGEHQVPCRRIEMTQGEGAVPPGKIGADFL